jgi:hypothetical protein
MFSEVVITKTSVCYTRAQRFQVKTEVAIEPSSS